VPDPGRAKHERYQVVLPASKPKYPPLPWECADVTMLNVYFEVRKDILLDYLPMEFNRTTPAYCRLFIVCAPKSRVGPFCDATLALGCRLNMMPAAFVAAAITDNPQVLAAGILERGYPNTLGKIELEADKSKAHAVVSDEKGPLIEVVMPLLQTIEPSRLAYDHVDAIKTANAGGGASTELVVTSPDIKIEQAAICKNARLEYSAERPDSAWQILRNRNLVSAQVVRGNRTFAAAHPPGAQPAPIPGARQNAQ
jgi:hypothetical protein